MVVRCKTTSHADAAVLYLGAECGAVSADCPQEYSQHELCAAVCDGAPPEPLQLGRVLQHDGALWVQRAAAGGGV